MIFDFRRVSLVPQFFSRKATKVLRCKEEKKYFAAFVFNFAHTEPVEMCVKII